MYSHLGQRSNSTRKGAMRLGTPSDRKWCWHTLYEENIARTYHISSCPVSSCIRVQPRTTRHRLKRDVWESCSTSGYLFWFKLYGWKCAWESARWRVTMHWRKGQWICVICVICSLPGARLPCLVFRVVQKGVIFIKQSIETIREAGSK